MVNSDGPNREHTLATARLSLEVENLIHVNESVLEWALSAEDDEVFKAMGAEFMDGAGKFPPAPVVKFGKELFAASEEKFRQVLCGPILTLLGKDSDMVTVTREVLAVIAVGSFGPEWANPIALTYAVVLVVRNVANGYCDGCIPS
jgi:hypothetical protein